jgi:iron complex outermembrane receptor protein
MWKQTEGQRERRSAAILAVALSLLGLTPVVHGADRKGIEEIIVTAERRAENVLEVPMTMSAFNDKTIEELGITNPMDLEQMVPGLQIGSAALQQRSDGQSITIRGIGTQSSREEHRDLAVATYIDGVYTADTYGLAPNLFDMERVEVARGPQGTLNGRNSIAGAISFYSKRPTDEWDAELMTEFTDQTTQRYNVAIGGPLNKDVSFRVTGGYLEGDGYQKNDGLGDDLGAPDQISISPQIRFQNDRLDVNLRYQHVRDKGSEPELVRFTEFARDNFQQNANWFLYDAPVPSVKGCNNPVVFGPFPQNAFTPTPATARVDLHCGGLKNRTLTNRDGTQDSQTDRVILNADWNVTDTLTLRYIYGSSETHTLGSQDGDQTSRIGSASDRTIPADLDSTTMVTCLFFGPGAVRSELDCWRRGQALVGLAFEDKEDNFEFRNKESSHEINLVSNFDGPFNFIAGLYYYENDTFWEQASLDFANPLRFVNADAAARAASPIFGRFPVTSCASYLNDFFLPTFGNPATRTAFGLAVGCPEGADNTKSSAFFSGTKDETTAAFVNVEYEFSEQWRVAGGLRWTKDRKKQTPRLPSDLAPAAGTVPAGFVPTGLFVGDFFGTGVPVAFTLTSGQRADDDWSRVIGYGSIEYSPVRNRLYYGRVSTGYRAGGFNFYNIALGNSFDEEKLTSYEIGAKGLFFEDRLQITSGLFYQHYKGYQVTATQLLPPEFITPITPTPLQNYTANVDDATKIWGFELEATFQITERIQVSGYYNYLDSKLGSFATVVRQDPDQVFTPYTFDPDGPGPRPPRTVQVPVPRDHAGDELPQMPNHKFSGAFAYTVPLEGMGALRFMAVYSYTGERWPQGGGNVPRTEIPSYDRWDLRANWTSQSTAWSVTAYVQNLLDDVGVAESIAIDGRGVLTEPRQYGVQVRWRPMVN